MVRAEDFVVEVRNRDLVRVGQITPDYLDLKAHLRWCGVGDWSLTLPGDHPMVPHLRTKGSGLVVTGPVGRVFHAGVWNPVSGSHTTEPWEEVVEGPVFSGPTRLPMKVRNQENPDGTLTFTGTTDEILLMGAVAFPDTGSADPATQSQANDTRTGKTEALLRQYLAYNVAPSHAQAGRIRGLRSKITLAGSDLGRGITQTKSPRFQNLLELLQEIVGADPELGFRLVQVGSILEFQVVESRDLTGQVRFDVDNGTLVSEEVAESGPTLTDAIIAGQGEGTERLIIQRTTPEATLAETEWGVPFERFFDRRDTEDPNELILAGDKELFDGRGGTSAKLVPSDDTTMRYGLDWRDGDLVTTVVEGSEGVARVTEAVFLFNKDTTAVGAALGDVSAFDPKDAEASRVQSIDSRVSNLERASAGPVDVSRLPSIPDTLLPTRLRGAAGLLGTVDLNTVLESGWYIQRLTVEATLARNYPRTRAGFLEVVAAYNGATSVGVLQRYTDYLDGQQWERSYYNGWTPWFPKSGPKGFQVTDWNDAIWEGQYWASSSANKPPVSDGWWVGTVTRGAAGSNDFVKQSLARPNRTQGIEFERISGDGGATWDPWENVGYDTGWITVNGEAGFSGAGRIRRIGNLVNLQGSLVGTWAANTTTTVMKIPTGFRPVYYLSAPSTYTSGEFNWGGLQTNGDYLTRKGTAGSTTLMFGLTWITGDATP